jgi:hypothetical protein
MSVGNSGSIDLRQGGNRVRRFFANYRLIMVIALMLPWFFAGGPGYDNARSFKEAWNLGHLLFFALFTMAADKYFSLCHRPTLAKYSQYLLMIVGFAFGIEFLQTLSPGRQSSLQDILLGVSGAVLVLLWHASGRVNKVGKIIFRSCGTGIISICLLPFLLTLYDEYRAWWDFPVLGDFESAFELSRWENQDRIARVQAPVRTGNFALTALFTTEKYSAIGIRYFPGDWGAAQALTFSVYNPGEMVVLHYRVHDWKHTGGNQEYDNRFNGQTSLAPGWNTITVPIAEVVSGPKYRRMDLAHIRGLAFFVTEQPYPRVLYFDDVRLLQ